MSFFKKMNNDIKFIGELVKSQNFNEVKDKIKEQHNTDKQFIKEVAKNIKETTNIVKDKISSDIVFVNKMTKVESLNEVFKNIKEQHFSDNLFVKDITGIDINKIEDDVINIVVEPIDNKYQKMKRAFIVFNILLYLFDTKIFFIFWISYGVYYFNL